jgi:hypothetical protein
LDLTLILTVDPDRIDISEYWGTNGTSDPLNGQSHLGRFATGADFVRPEADLLLGQMPEADVRGKF